MNQWVAILVALICLISPSLGRNWVGSYDQNDNGFNPYHSDHHGYKPHQEPDYDSSSEEFWDRDDDFTEHAEEYPDSDAYNHHHGINGFNDDGKFNYHSHKNPTFNHHNHGNHRFEVTESPGYGHPFHHRDNPIFDYHVYISNHHGHVNDKEEHGRKGENNGAKETLQNSHVNIDKANGRQRYDEKVGTPFDSPNSRPHDTVPSNTGNVDSASPVPVDLRNVNTGQGSVIDADRVVFPDSKRAPITSSPLASSSHAPGVTTLVPATTPLENSTFIPVPQAPLPDQSTLSPTLQGFASLRPAPETNAPATMAPTGPLLDVVRCVRACPTTSEYNPVCGSNDVTYNNPSVLECTRNCGVDVSLARQARCPRPIPLPLLQLLMDDTNATTNLNATSVNTVPPLISDATETPK